MAQEEIDLERAKTDFGYFVTHCIVDSRTGRKLKFSNAQLEEIRKIQAMVKTIARLREEKQELLDNVCDLIVGGKVYWILKGDKEALAELIRKEFSEISYEN